MEFEGRIETISPPDIKVAGRRVITDSATRIEGEDNQLLTFADLRVGEFVAGRARTAAERPGSARRGTGRQGLYTAYALVTGRSAGDRVCGREA